MRQKQGISKNMISKYIVVLTLALCIVPFFIHGKDSFVAVLDYVDSIVGFTKMYKDQHLFYKIDTPMPALQGISTTFYTFVNYSVYNFIMNYMDTYWGHVTNYVIEILIGYFSMCLLLRHIWRKEEHKAMIRLIAIAYAILPVIPNVALAYSTLPLITYVFLTAWEKREGFDKRYLLLFLYPFFSSFYIVGIFVYGFWLIGIIVHLVKYRKWNKNLMIGLGIMILATFIVDAKLFYSVLYLKETLNRVIFTTSQDDFFVNFKMYLIYGYFHASTVQKYIIIPTCGLYGIYLALEKWNSREFWWCVGLSVTIILFIALGALRDSGLINQWVASLIPLLDGFNWGRIVFFNRVLWYIFFTTALIGMMKNRYTTYLAYALAIAQIVNIYLAPEVYNDPIKNLRHAETLTQEDAATWREFYSEDLFEQIKKDINYQGEVTVAYGYFPGVLMYNGFHCLDGYMSSYPLKNMVAFRRLIEPELEQNQNAQEYFDSWGGRMYLYSSDITYNVQREQSTVPVNCNIDIAVYKEFGGKYILSRVPIKNDQELGITLVKQYVGEYYYNMYVYQVD